nr:pentatricopeptide repeat-containing protein [Tanacetum cinerariifolium]
MDRPDDEGFKIHYYGVFIFDPLWDADVHALYDKHVTIDLSNIKKEHEIKKKYVGMSIEELVVWAEDETKSRYLSHSPIKSRPLRKDFKGNHEEEGFDYHPLLIDDEVCQDNLVPRSCDLENKGIHDAAKILEEKYADAGDTGLGLTSLAREHEKYIEALLSKLKAKGMEITDPFIIVEKTKERSNTLEIKETKGISKTFALNDGDFAIQDHYGLLRSYAKALAESNKGSTVKVGVILNPNEKSYFDKFYVCFKGFRKQFGGVEFRGLFSKASYLQLFNKIMEKIKRASPRAQEYLTASQIQDDDVTSIHDDVTSMAVEETLVWDRRGEDITTKV